MADEILTRYEQTLEAKQIMADKLSSIPSRVAIKGTLALPDSPLEELPPDIDILATLDLSGSQVKNLNEGIRIFGNLILSRARITSLPSNLFVEGNLTLKDSHITELPAFLTVCGEIDLADSKVTRLSDNLVVTRLSLANTDIKELPLHLTVESGICSTKTINEPLFLAFQGSLITHIPDYAGISNLNLENTNVLTYGEKVRVQYLTLGNKEFTGLVDPLFFSSLIIAKAEA